MHLCYLCFNSGDNKLSKNLKHYKVKDYPTSLTLPVIERSRVHVINKFGEQFHEKIKELI